MTRRANPERVLLRGAEDRLVMTDSLHLAVTRQQHSSCVALRRFSRPKPFRARAPPTAGWCPQRRRASWGPLLFVQKFPPAVGSPKTDYTNRRPWAAPSNVVACLVAEPRPVSHSPRTMTSAPYGWQLPQPSELLDPLLARQRKPHQLALVSFFLESCCLSKGFSRLTLLSELPVPLPQPIVK